MESPRRSPGNALPHAERRWQPTPEQVEKLGARCSLCSARPFATETARRTLGPVFDPDRTSFVLGLVCTEQTYKSEPGHPSAPRWRRRAGCSEPLGRIASGVSKVAILQRLDDLEDYRRARTSWPPSKRLDQPIARSVRRAAARIGVDPGMLGSWLQPLDQMCQICTARPGTEIDHVPGTRVPRGRICKSCNPALRVLDHDPSWADNLRRMLSGPGVRTNPRYSGST